MQHYSDQLYTYVYILKKYLYMVLQIANTITTPSSSPVSSLLSEYSVLIAPEVGRLFASGAGWLVPGVERLVPGVGWLVPGVGWLVPGVGRLVPGIGRLVVAGTLPGRITVL